MNESIMMNGSIMWKLWFDQVWMALNQAGAVTLPLLGCAVVIYYWLGHRFWALWVSAQSRLSYLNTFRGAHTHTWPYSLLEGRLEALSQEFKLDLDQGVKALEVAIMCSPLLGLLGTVSGMMTTFDSLGDQSLLSQASVGVAAGISEALFSTQLGLMISIPGLLIGRLLQKRQRQLELKIEEICAHILNQRDLTSPASGDTL